MSGEIKKQPPLKALENVNLKKQIEEKEVEALELSKKLLNLQWRIKKSDLVAFYEERERDRNREIIKELSDKISEAEERWSGLDKRLEESKLALGTLNAEKELNALELQRLREINHKNETKHFDINRTVSILKNRNAAMKFKLKKQIREFDDHIQILSSRWTEP